MINALDSLRKDLQFALRQLWKRPGFSLTAIAVLALGLGANAAIFSVVNAVLLQPLPFAHPEKLVALFEKDVVPDDPYNDVAPGSYFDWIHYSTSFVQIAASRETRFNLSSQSQTITPERVFGMACSANLFKTLGVSPVLGRGFRTEEGQQNTPHVAVISYGLWKHRFAGSHDATNRQIQLDGIAYNIVGVMPRTFRYGTRDAQVWVPLNRFLSPEDKQSYDNHILSVIGRLRSDRTVEQSQTEINAIVKRYHNAHPAELMGKGATVVRLDWYLVRDVKTSLLVLGGAVACLLAIACVNIANLLLTRALGRQREFAIRGAVGATRARIILQLLIESLAISIAGALAGLAIAIWGAPFLAAYAPGAGQLPQIANIHVNLTVFLFTMTLALATGLLAGLFPAFGGSHTDLANNLREGGRANTSSRSHTRFRGVLIVTEVALSAMLLIAAGLLLRSFAQLQQEDTGFRTNNTVTVGISLPEAAYSNRAAVAAFVHQLDTRLQGMPGLDSVGLVNYPPLAGSWSDSVFHIEGHPFPPGQMMVLQKRDTDPHYFKAAGIPLLKGRLFNGRDNRGYDDAHPEIDPILLSQSAVKKYFGNFDPLGQRIIFGSDAGPSTTSSLQPVITFQVIGVVGDVILSPGQPGEPMMYRPLYNGDARYIYIVAHTVADPQAITSPIRAAIHRLNPDLPVHDIRTLNQIAAESTIDRRFSLVLLSLFAGLALLLASVGLYGVVSYSVSQRTDEIGIRLALGASRLNINRMVLLGGMKPALAGIVTGLIAAAAVTRTLQSLLFGVSAMDPITFLIVPFVLLFVVVLACALPAYRASRIDPMTALRAE